MWKRGAAGSLVTISTVLHSVLAHLTSSNTFIQSNRLEGPSKSDRAIIQEKRTHFRFSCVFFFPNIFISGASKDLNSVFKHETFPRLFFFLMHSEVKSGRKVRDHLHLFIRFNQLVSDQTLI